MYENTMRARDRPDLGTVLDESINRCYEMFEEFDRIFLAYSGGKDSTTVLNTVMTAWDQWEDEHGEVPVDRIELIHHDDEFAYPETEAILEDNMRKWNDRLKLWWVVMPMKYGLATTRNENYWFTWDPRYQDVWIRPMPDGSKFHGDEYGEVQMIFADDPSQEDFEVGEKHKQIAKNLIHHYACGDEKTIELTGVRAAEGLRRHTRILQFGGWKSDIVADNFIVGHPCYDWGDDDLWAIHNERDWDYNAAYDKLHKLGYSPREMRTAHPFGHPSVNNDSGWEQRFYWPDLYQRWVRRVEAGAQAFEFGIEFAGLRKPDDLNWKQYTYSLLESLDGDAYVQAKRTIERRLERHWNHSNVPLQETQRCPRCSESWRDEAKYAYQKANDIVLAQV